MLVPGQTTVVGAPSERVISLRCIVCGSVHSIREAHGPTRHLGSLVEIELEAHSTPGSRA